MSEGLSLAELLGEIGSLLDRAGIEEPRREARLLVEHACGLSRTRQIAEPGQAIPAMHAGNVLRLAERRASGEPFARIVGRCEFWSLEFELGPETLVPRPDSETLIEAALARIGDRDAALRLLDLGTGTGCLLLALLSELPAAAGCGIDIAPRAVQVARANAARLGFLERAEFVCGDWSGASLPLADIVIANPPYIPRGEIAGLAREVAVHDPQAALDGGDDGLDAYRSIAAKLDGWLAPSGFAVLEIGRSQEVDVTSLFALHGWRVVVARRDLGGIVRALVLKRAADTKAEKELGNDR